MRVLQLHNRYRHPGGEERAVADIGALLRRHGHETFLLERSSENVSRATAARGLLAGGLHPEEVEAAVARTGAEVVHAHNIHPLLGWRALAAAQRAGARTILHLHNFRLFCAIAVAYREGERCFRCRGANTLPGLALRCRGSVPEGSIYAAGLTLAQRRLWRHVDRFVAVSSATQSRLHELGLPTGRSTALPNFVADDGHAQKSRAGEGRYALVAGRLVPEKGYDTAIAVGAACRRAAGDRRRRTRRAAPARLGRPRGALRRPAPARCPGPAARARGGRARALTVGGAVSVRGHRRARRRRAGAGQRAGGIARAGGSEATCYPPRTCRRGPALWTGYGEIVSCGSSAGRRPWGGRVSAMVKPAIWSGCWRSTPANDRRRSRPGGKRVG